MHRQLTITSTRSIVQVTLALGVADNLPFWNWSVYEFLTEYYFHPWKSHRRKFPYHQQASLPMRIAWSCWLLLLAGSICYRCMSNLVAACILTQFWERSWSPFFQHRVQLRGSCFVIFLHLLVYDCLHPELFSWTQAQQTTLTFSSLFTSVTNPCTSVNGPT